MDTAFFRTLAKRCAPARATLLATLIWCALAPADGLAKEPIHPTSTPAARSLSGLSPSVRRQLDAAFALAHRALEGSPACHGLFSELDQPATRSLRHTLYVPASARHEQRLCARGVSAFTEVGSRVTYLCRDFGQLAAPKAAMILVHEALHLAGQEEAPRSSDAPSSAEINGLVASNCGF